MRTDSHRLAGTLVALGFIAGWLSASWVDPPTVTTQARPVAPITVVPDIRVPRVRLAAVSAPDTRPAVTRNPFAFSGGEGALSRSTSIAGVASADTADATSETSAAAPTTPAAPVMPWRLAGIAEHADGRRTAVLTSDGGVALVTIGDTLAEGSRVVAIESTAVVVELSTGERVTLALHE